MFNTLEKIVDILIAVLLMFLLPVFYFNMKKDGVIQVQVEKETAAFVENVTVQGYVTRQMYEKYLKDIVTTGKLYSVELCHEQMAYEPEYIFRTPGEVIEDDESRWEGINEYYEAPVHTEIPHIDDPINSGNLNTETNESVLEKAVNTPADPNHEHTEDCYGGHKHMGTPYFIHRHAHDGACIEYVSCIIVASHCNTCKEDYYGGAAYYYWDEATRSVKTSSSDFSSTARCPNCGWTDINNEPPLQYYAYSCGYNRRYIYGDPEGAGEHTPRGIEFEYERSNPQDITGGTFVSGCYTYHQSKYVNDFYRYNEYGSLINGSVVNAVNKMIYTDRFQGYCSIPLYYTVGLSDSNTYHNGDGFSGPATYYTLPNLCRLQYKAYVSESGKVRFKFISHWRNLNLSSGSIFGTDNPGFPDDISINEFAALQPVSLFNEVFGVDYNYEYRGAIVKHVQCMNNAHDYESLDTCDFDHSLSENRWVSTCGYGEDSTPDCSQIIVSLVPTYPVQTVYTNDPLITTAVATFMDGSKKTVLCNTEYVTKEIVTDQMVVIIYVNEIDGQTYTHIATITVTVIPRSKTCPQGHLYNLNPDGTDPGCPYCKGWLRRLHVYIPSEGKLTIYRNINASLEAEGVCLLAEYLDGSTELIYSGYTDNLDSDYVGIQIVTIGYKGLTTHLTVEVLRNRKQCEVCHLYYNLYLDDTDPGCPYCRAKVPVFTGNVMTYCRNTYRDDIITELYEGSGTYYFRRGDNFIVKIESRNKVSYTNIVGMQLKIRATRADTVKDEAIHK